ncbi:hypothetical protein PENSPDRAFT_692656 [Peniophora sp. CONT]|nr:hypothetical protein PENSPDRAFT_692656 [Peniophora sp. CONT]
MNVQDIWMSFARSQTAQFPDLRPSNSPEVRALAHNGLSSHYHSLYAVQSMLGQRMNWLTPIYLLPDEILMRIFVYVCAARSPNASPPTDLMIVSRRWRAVIDGFPGVWAYPPLYTSRAKIDALLSRSKSAALHLDWELRGLSPPVFGPSDEPRNGTTLSPLTAQARTISLEASTPVLLEVMRQLGSETTASRLDILDVNVDASLPDPPPMALNQMTPALWPNRVFETPRLRQLKLTNFGYFDWSHALLCSTLTLLELSFCGEPWIFTTPGVMPGPLEAAPGTYDRLLDALERLRSLEDLSLLRCVSVSLLLGPNSDEYRKVDMKQLRTLRVYDSSRACAILSQNISLSKDAVAFYMFNWAGQADIANVAALCAHNPSMRKRSSLRITFICRPREGKSILFNFHDDDDSVGRVAVSARTFPTLNAEDGTLAEPTNDTWHHEICATMAAALPLRRIAQLDVEIDGNMSPLPRSVWLRSFSHAPNVRFVAVEAYSVPMLSGALRHHASNLHGVTTRLFPHLREARMIGGSLRELSLLSWASDERGRRGFDISHDIKPSRILGRIICVQTDGTRTIVRGVYNPKERRYKPRLPNTVSVTQALQDRDRKRRTRESTS